MICVKSIPYTDLLILTWTSESLNEGLRIIVAKKLIFCIWKKVVGADLEYPQKAFLIGQVVIQKYGLKTQYLMFNIYKLEKGFCSYPAVTKLILLPAAVVVHDTHII